ncbi:HAD family hydrolase [Bacillus sp. FJAT-50079]|uniref:HAD family hydrolase n=1 Tax=Bacillus sp. FJAT-50079 TaxID=2833577 RepID=UPI001BCA1646|nr:HAD family hydrolase [Bacillus sp. FJAT-50079]MBS4207884.1 HAD family hydrolase [Bacillus sp. FJAT-50079]
MKLLSNKSLEFLDTIHSPKLIAMDVDGTLVPHGGTVSEYTRKMLVYARNKGIEVVLVTARPPRWLGPVVEALGFPTVAICGNGAITVHTKDFSVLNMVAIAKDVASTVVKEMKKIVPDVVFAAEAVDVLRAGPGYQDLPPGVRQAEGLVPEDRYKTILSLNSLDEMLKPDVYKIVAETFILDAEEFLEKAREAVGEIVAVTRSVAGRAYIEFGPLGLSKAETLADYSDGLGFGASEVIAFGDMPNDIEMLQWAGTGVAMGNSHADLIQVANLVAPDAAEDGIAIVLEHILSRK